MKDAAESFIVCGGEGLNQHDQQTPKDRSLIYIQLYSPHYMVAQANKKQTKKYDKWNRKNDNSSSLHK